MTSRCTGRRVAAGRRSRTVNQSRTSRVRRKEEPLKPRERRLLIQLVLCGSVFVLLVAAKLLLPARMEQLQMRLGEAMEQNVDVQAVFSAVGRAFSGESEITAAADEVYRAVFHMEGEAVETSAQIPDIRAEAALDTLRDHRPAVKTPDAEPAEAPAVEELEVSPLSYVLYSGQNLPENVSMEQVVLGFDYTAPVRGVFSSVFGYREHPLEGEERFHYGIDIAADSGTEVGCFADGTVTAVGESSSYGKYCTVAHENGFSTLYAHCERITTSSGAAVKRGETIARVGETGMATGPHLHFELQRQGAYLNPIYYVSGI